MSRLRAPAFWWREPGLLSAALALPARIYGTVADRRLRSGARTRADLPVLCIGNFTVGGAGKTPAALALAQAAQAMGLHPGFLSRGYGGGGGRDAPLLVDPAQHDATVAGDEPLLLADRAPTVVARDRAAGARRLQGEGCDIVLMDDGFQSARLHPDLALLVVDGLRGVGNAHPLPAGPLRASLALQMSRAGAVLLVGEGEAGARLAAHAQGAGRPVYRARSHAPNGAEFAGLRCLAFSGIADGAKFRRALEAAGATVVAETRFADHHRITGAEARSLLQEADSLGVTLVTTPKDHARMRGTMSGPVRALGERSRILQHRLEIEGEGAHRLVEATLQAFQRRARS